MKKKLTTALCLVLVLVLVLSISGCVLIFPAGAYFATWDELNNFYYEEGERNRERPHSSKNSGMSRCYYPDMSNDERFKESAYIIYNTNGEQLNENQLFVHNDANYVAFRVEIDGESIYILGFYQSTKQIEAFEDMPTRLYNLKDIAKPTDGREYYNWFEDRKSYLTTYPFIKGYAPKDGFIKDFTNISKRHANEIFDNSIWFGSQEVESDSKAVRVKYLNLWGVYDTRDIPQEEKEALAAELMQALYDNLKLIGQKAE